MFIFYLPRHSKGVWAQNSCDWENHDSSIIFTVIALLATGWLWKCSGTYDHDYRTQ
jgi:hypothetical protein